MAWRSPKGSRRVGIAGTLALLAAIAALGAARAEAAPMTFTVNVTADTDDGSCDAGDCSLREAVIAANGNSGELDTIKFDASVFSPATIALTADMWGITDPVVIDGLDGAGDCDGGNPQVNIDASGATNQGFILSGPNADGSTVCGVAVHSAPGPGLIVASGVDGVTLSEVFAGTDVSGSATGLGNASHGISILGDGALVEDSVAIDNSLAGLNVDGGSATVQGSRFGIAADGSAVPNQHGIQIGSGAGGAQIGGTAPADGNVISGNQFAGILSGAEAGTIEGNLIGTDPTGASAVTNGRDGVNLSGANNILGGTTPGAGNVISGNGEAGVELFGAAAQNNQVVGNRIGVDLGETTTLGNTAAGVQLSGGATGNTIGGTAAGAGNVIGGTPVGNPGVLIAGASTGNAVEGNYIGTNASNATLGNSVGVALDGSSGNTVGGTTAAHRNVISGLNGIAVQISGDSNTVEGNYIGTTVDGLLDNGNSHEGVLIDGGSENQIGTAAAPNVISGANNATQGVGVEITGEAADGNVVQANLIGTDKDGTAPIPDEGGGVLIHDGPDSNQIGGAGTGEGNVISGNAVNLKDGIRIAGAQTTENAVLGNLIGLASDGSALGNAAAGVYVSEAPGTEIGAADTSADATDAGARNVIGANAGAGVEITGVATGRAVRGNFIGTAIDGSDGSVGNLGDGVLLSTTDGVPDDVEIGGAVAGEGNRIRHNVDDGVAIVDGVRNTVSRNEISDNGDNVPVIGDLGIDLGDDGVTANDPGDGDGGPNGLQNFPDLTSFETNPVESRVEGTLDSEPNGDYTIEVFGSADCDPSQRGEGETFLGSFQVTTDGAGDASFSEGVATTAVGERMTATATDAEGNTSEFSVCWQIVADSTPPQTTISSGPADGSVGNDPTPTLAFEANEAGASFECEIDGGGYSACSSPLTLPELADGPHSFGVRATDAGANTDPSPAERSFTVDTVAPETTITSGPADGEASNDTTPSFGFASSEAGSQFACRLGSGAFGACPGGGGASATLGPLADGSYTFSVRATDVAGNADASPAQRAFTVDTVVTGAKLKAKRRQRQRGRKVKLKLKLKAKEAASARAKGRIVIKGGGGASAVAATVRLQPASRELAAGKRRVLRLRVKGSKGKRRRLERRVHRALDRGRKVRAKVQVRFQDEAGNSELAKRTIALR